MSRKLGSTMSYASNHDSHDDTVWYTIRRLVESRNPRCIALGVENIPTVDILNELAECELTFVDDFDHLGTESGRRRHAELVENLQLAEKSHKVMMESTTNALTKLTEVERVSETPGYDWIHLNNVDEASVTVLDGGLAWRIARKDAIIVFGNDREMSNKPNGVNGRLHPSGVETFMALHDGEFEIVPGIQSHQLILKKTSEISIDKLNKNLLTDFGPTYDDGLCVAFAMDSDYSLPGAVAIQSILRHTPGRIYFFILDLGMSDRDHQRIQDLAANNTIGSATFVFIPLPDGNISTKPGMGKSWAKIDLLTSLPVTLKKAVLLDADILVRKDLQDLWKELEDLEGCSIGAAPHVRYPKGHTGPFMPEIPTSYFNDGVIIADMALLRENIQNILQLSEQMKTSLFKEQDVLNVYFHGNWKRLSLRWNAQGIGTYASSYLIDKSELQMHDTLDPCIVHFTGPINPSLSEVVDRTWQPYTSKPWGYAGSPGHPFADEWWRVLNETPWREWIQSPERYNSYERARESAVREAIREYQRKVGRSDLWLWMPRWPQRTARVTQ